MRNYTNIKMDIPFSDIKDLIKELKHLGSSVMDVYTGSLHVMNICNEVVEYLKLKGISTLELFIDWAGTDPSSFRIVTLSDGSQWTLKCHDNKLRFVHIFPARYSQHTFRVKANTLKSALIYNILIGKDLVSVDDLNRVRPLLGLSPIKDSVDNIAIFEMIEILRV